MRKVFGLALLAFVGLPLLPAQAGGVDATGKVGTVLAIPAMRFDMGAKFWFKAQCDQGCGYGGGGYGGGGYGGGGGGGGLGPWYLYWPLEAHFQTPAMPQYPYWPNPQAPYGAGIGGGQMAPAGYGAYGGYGGGVQPAGYSMPSYWYGR